MDLRLTVDYPEDLILCRAVYDALASSAPLIPLRQIISFLDGRPDLTELVRPWAVDGPSWAGQPQRPAEAARPS